jgi:DNA-binding response OmpR family regulator
MSGYTDRLGKRVETEAYIQKPFTPNALLARIQEALGGTESESVSISVSCALLNEIKLSAARSTYFAIARSGDSQLRPPDRQPLPKLAA